MPKSVLKKAIPYVDSLTLPYRDNVFSFEFAALSYANSHKNRYRYKLENFEPGWNEVDSKQRLATYTNLDPGKYVFRVQGSNSDGVWNEEGVSLTIVITPPWWSTSVVSRPLRCPCRDVAVGSLPVAVTAVASSVRDDAGGACRRADTHRARTSRHTASKLPWFAAAASRLFPSCCRSARWKHKEQLDRSIERAAKAITEGRDAVQGLRASTVQTNDLALAISTLGEELATDSTNHATSAFRVTVEGEPRDLHPILA